MKSIVRDILRFYDEIEHGNCDGSRTRLQSLDIRIITDFLENVRWMERFYESTSNPSIRGWSSVESTPAGSVRGRSESPSSISGPSTSSWGTRAVLDSEKSARFFYSVVKHLGPGLFYSTFYVTNVSRLGFTKDGRNINYYRLPEDIQDVILDQFTHEMDLVDPTHIISTGREVERTLASLKASGRIRADIGLRLGHPRWCGIDRNRAACFREYVDLLGRFIGPGMQA